MHNKSLVIFGGSDGREVHSSVWILSLETFHWERVRHGSHEIIPPPRLYHSSVSLGGSFFIHGGSSKVALDGQQAFLKDCQEFQLESREWRPVESRGNNPSCCGHTAAIYQDMMVLFFFSKKKKKKLFEFFDYRSWSEVTGASLPSQMPSLALILLQAHGRYLEHPSRPSPI